MSIIQLNPIGILIGAVRGAVNEVIPDVQRDVADKITVAHQTPDAAPLPASVRGPAISAEAVERAVLDRVLADPRVQSFQQATTPIAWYQSPVVTSLLTSLLVALLGLFGITVAPGDYVTIGAAIGSVLVAGSAVVGLIGRLRNPAQPVTLTKPKG